MAWTLLGVRTRDMDERLQIAPEVDALLDPATLADAVAKREHTELACSACGGPIAPEAPEPASLVLVRTADRGARTRYLVCFAHAGCASSQVVDDAAAAPARMGSVTWTPVLRDGARPRAALLLELHDYAATGDLAVPVTEAVGRAEAPLVDGAALTLAEGALELTLPDLAPLRLDESEAVFPDGWHDAVRADRAVLLLAGTGMGLDRPDADRIDRALQLGRVVGATIAAG